MDTSQQNAGPLAVGRWQSVGTPFIFANKVLLEHSHAHSFIYCLWRLSQFSGRNQELWHRPSGPQNLKHLLSGPLRKSWLTSAQHLYISHKFINLIHFNFSLGISVNPKYSIFLGTDFYKANELYLKVWQTLNYYIFWNFA